MTDSHALRRWPTLGASIVLAVMMGATACSSDDAGSDAAITVEEEAVAEETTTTGASETETEAAFPVTITHIYGEAVISEQPARVVALSSTDADTAAALGVVPVGVAQSLGVASGEVPPWLDPATDDQDIEILATADGWPFEEIAALQPDVIVGMYTGMTPEDYDVLAAIAPTVAPQVGPYQDHWTEITTTVGTALGQYDDAVSLVAGADAYVAAVAKEHPEFAGKTFVVADLSQPDAFLVLADPNESTVSMLSGLGFALPDDIASLERDLGFAATVSKERMELLDASVTIFAAANPDSVAEYEASPIFQSLGVSERGAVINMELPLFAAIRQPSTLTIPFAVDQLVELLAEVDLGDAD